MTKKQQIKELAEYAKNIMPARSDEDIQALVELALESADPDKFLLDESQAKPLAKEEEGGKTSSEDGKEDDSQESPPRERQGAQNRPHCPRCSDDEETVLMVATSTPPPGIFTWYACPNKKKCGSESVKVMRPQAAEIARRRQQKAAAGDIGER